MAKAKPKAKAKNTAGPRLAALTPEQTGISAISVEGFKSIHRKTEIAIRPLTILAGANSSGKSSIMQPVLLMKQTLEVAYDPGALLLDGWHVRFTAAEQLFSTVAGRNSNRFSARVESAEHGSVAVRFQRQAKGGLDVAEMTGARSGHAVVLRRGMSEAECYDALLGSGRPNAAQYVAALKKAGSMPVVDRDRCFLVVRAEDRYVLEDFHWMHLKLREMLHLPALRGNPERTYRTTAFGADFPGTFESYVASIIHHWQIHRDIRLKQLGAALQRLGLNWKIEASRVDDTRVELRVGRLKSKTSGGARDLVSIADVGFGVSQCLPVLVALLVARPGQLVYIEEPEIHLHPRAQVALAQILADAANRGVRVVIETHSALLLLGVQALVAEGALPADRVALHWFSLDEDGATKVRSADLDETGAFGDWPEDFADVTLDAQARYLDAAEKRLARGLAKVKR